MKKLFNKFSSTQKKTLLIAMVAAWIATSIPIISYVTYFYTTAAHELGHTFTAWSFGYIAIPTFDFINGGGFTRQISRPIILCIAVFVFVLVNLRWLKLNSKFNDTKKLSFLFILYVFIFFTGIHQFLISLMGTVGEILFSFLLAWYALSKVKNKLDMKGVFYMFLSMLLWVNIVSFAWSLIFDTQAKIKYSNGIQQVLGGDPLTNDLVKLYDASSLPVTFYSWLLLILSALSIYLLSRMVDVKFPTKQKFKDYFMALFAILKIQTVSLINRFK